ncbi:hypothetical protein BC832DRAFT_555778 [Gaertneriomyces semiglobifer]|nr:hypothetical protein BC832DRAFT_555778 [Gaertneriomyces semiglobifer]
MPAPRFAALSLLMLGIVQAKVITVWDGPDCKNDLTYAKFDVTLDQCSEVEVYNTPGLALLTQSGDQYTLKTCVATAANQCDDDEACADIGPACALNTCCNSESGTSYWIAPAFPVDALINTDYDQVIKFFGEDNCDNSTQQADIPLKTDSCVPFQTDLELPDRFNGTLRGFAKLSQDGDTFNITVCQDHVPNCDNEEFCQSVSSACGKGTCCGAPGVSVVVTEFVAEMSGSMLSARANVALMAWGLIGWGLLYAL